MWSRKSIVSENDQDPFMADSVKKILDNVDVRSYIYPDTLFNFSASVSPNTTGLGPAFKYGPPKSLNQFYPLPEKKLPFTMNFKSQDSKCPFFFLRGCHTPSRNWIDWVNRVEPEKGELWRKLDIYDAIMFSKYRIYYEKPLLLASLFFWSVSTNAFHFRCGMMSPTIQDVCFLTGLRPHGEEVNPLLSNPDVGFDFPMKGTEKGPKMITSYRHFMSLYRGTGPVTQTEHIAFLLYWLNKCLFRGPAGGMTKEFAQVAIALASGRKLALAPLLLAHLYRAIHDTIAGSFTNCAGPLWLLQFWLQAYFPGLGPQIKPDPDVPLYGYHYLTAQPKKQSFAACFCYFYDQEEYRRESFTPFLPRTKGPKWLRYDPGEAPPEDAEEHHDVWSNFLIARDLFYSPGRVGSTKYKCGVEFYNAAQSARQFGLTQLVPLPPFYSFNTFFSSRKIFTSEAQIRSTSAIFQYCKNHFQVIEFGGWPLSTSDFDMWWFPYISTTRKEEAGSVLRRLGAFFGSLESIKPVCFKRKAALPPRTPIPSAYVVKKEVEEEPLAEPSSCKKVRKSKTTSTAFLRRELVREMLHEVERRRKKK